MKEKSKKKIIYDDDPVKQEEIEDFVDRLASILVEQVLREERETKKETE